MWQILKKFCLAVKKLLSETMFIIFLKIFLDRIFLKIARYFIVL